MTLSVETLLVVSSILLRIAEETEKRAEDLWNRFMFILGWEMKRNENIFIIN